MGQCHGRNTHLTKADEHKRQNIITPLWHFITECEYKQTQGVKDPRYAKVGTLSHCIDRKKNATEEKHTILRGQKEE